MSFQGVGPIADGLWQAIIVASLLRPYSPGLPNIDNCAYSHTGHTSRVGEGFLA